MVIKGNTVCSDADLMSSVAAGDDSAVRPIVLRYGDMVYRTAVRILCDRDKARDVAQETFIRLWKKAGAYDPRFPLNSWLYRITVNLCLDQLRRDRLLHPFSDLTRRERLLDGLVPSEASPEELLVLRESWSLFVRASQSLSPKQRIVFTLRELEDLDTQSVSELTGMSPDQIKSNLHFARRKIMEVMRSDDIK